MATQQQTGNILPTVSPFDTKSLQDQVTPIDTVDLSDYWRAKQMELSNKNLELQNKKILVDLEEAKARQKLYDKQLKTQNKAAAKELIKYHRELGGDTVTADDIYMLPKDLQDPLLQYQNKWAQIASMGENLNFDPDTVSTAANQLLSSQASDPKYREAKNFLNAFSDLRKKIASPKYQIDEMLYNDFIERLSAGEVKNVGEFNEKNFIIDDKYIQGLGKEVVKQIKTQKYVIPEYIKTGDGRGYWKVTENKANKEGIYNMIQENLSKDPGANRYAELTAKSLNLENRGTSIEPVTKESVLKQIADQVTAGVFTLSADDLTEPSSVDAKGFVNPSSGGGRQGGNYTINIPNLLTGGDLAIDKSNTERSQALADAIKTNEETAKKLNDFGLYREGNEKLFDEAYALTKDGSSININAKGKNSDGNYTYVELQKGTDMATPYLTQYGEQEKAKYIKFLGDKLMFNDPNKDFLKKLKYENDPKLKIHGGNGGVVIANGEAFILFKPTTVGGAEKRITLKKIKATNTPKKPENVNTGVIKSNSGKTMKKAEYDKLSKSEKFNFMNS